MAKATVVMWPTHLDCLLEVHGRHLAGLLGHRHALHRHVRAATQVQRRLEEDAILHEEEERLNLSSCARGSENSY